MRLRSPPCIKFVDRPECMPSRGQSVARRGHSRGPVEPKSPREAPSAVASLMRPMPL